MKSVAYKVLVNEGRKQKVKTFLDLNDAKDFSEKVSERTEGWAGIFIYGLSYMKGGHGFKFHLTYIDDAGNEHDTQTIVELVKSNDDPKCPACDGVKIYGADDGKGPEELFKTVNKALKAWDKWTDEQEQAYYEDMANAYYGIGNECSTCRGGGCVHCEPNRFI